MFSVPGPASASFASCSPWRSRFVPRSLVGPGALVQPVPQCAGVFRSWTRAGSLVFPGHPSHTSARLSDPGRTGRTSPFAVLPMLPPADQHRRLQRGEDIEAQPRALVSAAYASRAALPPPMQGSLPAGGLRLCRGGVEPPGSLRKVSVYIHPPFQDFSRRNGHPIELSRRHAFVIAKPVVIERNVWIAAGATIIGGAIVGENSVVAANSVVTKDVPPNSLSVGIRRARFVRLPTEQKPAMAVCSARRGDHLTADVGGKMRSACRRKAAL